MRCPINDSASWMAIWLLGELSIVNELPPNFCHTILMDHYSSVCSDGWQGTTRVNMRSESWEGKIGPTARLSLHITLTYNWRSHSSSGIGGAYLFFLPFFFSTEEHTGAGWCARSPLMCMQGWSPITKFIWLIKQMKFRVPRAFSMEMCFVQMRHCWPDTNTLSPQRTIKSFAFQTLT